MSWGLPPTPQLEMIFAEFLGWIERNKIPVVLAAGNEGNAKAKLHQVLPQRYGTKDNTIVTVGGVQQDGTLYRATVMEEPGKGGSMTVYAPAVDVVVPSPGRQMHTGTSQAAAIVSGLVAYYYANPILNFRPNEDLHVERPIDNVKEFLVQHAWTRIPIGEAATSLNVPYNLARGDPLHADKPCPFEKRDDEGASACSLIRSTMVSQSAPASTFSSQVSSLPSSTPSAVNSSSTPPPSMESASLSLSLIPPSTRPSDSSSPPTSTPAVSSKDPETSSSSPSAQKSSASPPPPSPKPEPEPSKPEPPKQEPKPSPAPAPAPKPKPKHCGEKQTSMGHCPQLIPTQPEQPEKPHNECLSSSGC